MEAWRADPERAIDHLCSEIVSGGNLWAYCGKHGLPYTTVRSWIDADESRAAKYARAREDRSDMLADEIVSISDEVETIAQVEGEETVIKLDAAAIARNRLRVDARKWVAAKLKPRVYGDKVETQVTGADGGPVQHSISVKFVE